MRARLDERVEEAPLPLTRPGRHAAVPHRRYPCEPQRGPEQQQQQKVYWIPTSLRRKYLPFRRPADVRIFDLIIVEFIVTALVLINMLMLLLVDMVRTDGICPLPDGGQNL